MSSKNPSKNTNVIQEYESKQQQLERLQAELAQLEQSDNYKNEKQFQDSLKALMEKYEMGADKVIAILNPETKTAQSTGESTKKTRKPREEMKFRNPKTGEEVVTKGANNKTLRSWRDEYGSEVVATWRTA